MYVTPKRIFMVSPSSLEAMTRKKERVAKKNIEIILTKKWKIS